MGKQNMQINGDALRTKSSQLSFESVTMSRIIIKNAQHAAAILLQSVSSMGKPCSLKLCFSMGWG